MCELKCPFCQQELETGNYYVHCHNPHCNITVEMEGTEEMWQELIRARKALGIALNAIDAGEAALIGCQEADDKYISDVTAEDGLKLMSKAYKQIKELDNERT